MNTYHISGELVNEVFAEWGEDDTYTRDRICQEIEAESAQAAADAFEVDDWEWVTEPTVRLVSEALKMERLGQPTLFELPERK